MKILSKFCAIWRSWWTGTCPRSSRMRKPPCNRQAAACPRLIRWQSGQTIPSSPFQASNFPAYHQTPPPPPLHGSLRQPHLPHWVLSPHLGHPCGLPPTNEEGQESSKWGLRGGELVTRRLLAGSAAGCLTMPTSFSSIGSSCTAGGGKPRCCLYTSNFPFCYPFLSAISLSAAFHRV